MKAFITFLVILVLNLSAFAQTCTITGFDVCTGANPVTAFTNYSLVSGTDLAPGAKYKYTSITTSPSNLDAIITVIGTNNATLYSIDDDLAVNETGTGGSQAALFSPKIGPSSNLTGADQRGYVEFTVTFYNHYAANTLPPAGYNPVSVLNLNFLHFDMDGFTVGTNGYFREIGYVKRASATSSTVYNLGASNTELSAGGTVSDASGYWLLTYGSTIERDGISRCAEVIEKTVYTTGQTTISFRMGYDYKAPFPYANQGPGKPQRQYGSKFGCFNLPLARLVPVALTSFSAALKNNTVDLNWEAQAEVNLSKYEICRSTDGRNFETIGAVNARNLSGAQTYTFTDNNLPKTTGMIYYRLRMKDIDGKENFSNTVAVKPDAGTATQGISIFPNPASSHAQIRYTATTTERLNIVVFDGAGKAVLTQTAVATNGNNNIVLNNVSQLSEGVYTVRVTTPTAKYSSKLMVWK